MTEDNSPYFAAGVEDGQRDKALIGSCPPWEPLGHDPDRAWSLMYMRGYERGFEGAIPHSCPQCRGPR